MDLRALAGAERVHVEFPSERKPHQAALLSALGVTWSVRPDPETARVETTVQALTETRDCVVPDCVGDASSSPRRGPYANRCDDHREAVRRRMAEGREAAAPTQRPAAPTPTGPSLTAATAVLHKTAKQLEDKVGRRRAATADAKATLAKFNDALNAVKQTAEQLISN